MKVYIHQGVGHYALGSIIIVEAESKLKAKELIKRVLVSNGLPKEKLSVKELKSTNGNPVLLEVNGDY